MYPTKEHTHTCSFVNMGPESCFGDKFLDIRLRNMLYFCVLPCIRSCSFTERGFAVTGRFTRGVFCWVAYTSKAQGAPEKPEVVGRETLVVCVCQLSVSAAHGIIMVESMVRDRLEKQTRR